MVALSSYPKTSVPKIDGITTVMFLQKVKVSAFGVPSCTGKLFPTFVLKDIDFCDIYFFFKVKSM